MNDHLIQALEQRSSELYSLAFLFTGSTDGSVQALNRAVNYEGANGRIFGQSMNEASRKLIILEALDSIEIELEASKQRTSREAAVHQSGNPGWKRRERIARDEFETAVLAIDVFPRCAMLLTIFERMSIGLAAVLLDADSRLTAAAQEIGIVQLTENLCGTGAGRYSASIPPLSLA
jgi:hypothetical protein